jgi:hypothetical protein
MFGGIVGLRAEITCFAEAEFSSLNAEKDLFTGSLPGSGYPACFY